MHRIRNLARKLPKKFATGKTENRSPNSINMHRDDRRLDSFHDSFQSAPERQHLSDPRHLPFGENAKQLAVLQSFGRGA